MKNFITLLLLNFLVSIGIASAQTNAVNNRSRINGSIGASVNYYYGQGDRNFGKFENERINWHINGMLGLVLGQNNDKKRTMIAIFGQYGFNNEKTIGQLLQDHNFTTSAVTQSDVNNFYQIEGGLLIAEILRISTGFGQQNFDKQILTATNGSINNTRLLKYYSSTVGFQFNFSVVCLILNCNFAYGNEFNNTVITPSAGLQFRF